jgi:hypothetical protein
VFAHRGELITSRFIMSKETLGHAFDMVLRIGQLFISFRSPESQVAAALALEPFSLAGGGVALFTAQDMQSHEAARWLGTPRDRLWLVAHPPGEVLTQWVTETVMRCGAASVHRFAGSTMTDLMNVPRETPQQQAHPDRNAIALIKIVDSAASSPDLPRSRCPRDLGALRALGKQQYAATGGNS